MFNVVLVAPEIPANTGNIGRTCVVTGSRLHLVGPIGFSLDDHALHRAGLAYWHSLDVSTYKNWDEFLRVNCLDMPQAEKRLHLLTKKARRTYAESHYEDGDYLVFGCESTGLPEGLLAQHAERCERIPMLPDHESLVDADAWRATQPAQDHAQLRRDACGNFVDPDAWKVSALNLSNAAAIVLYEALRQQRFPGMGKGED